MRTKGLSPLIFHGVSNSSASVNASFAFTSGIAYVAAGIRLEALTSMFYQSRTIGA
jgi:citrate synthase